MAKKRVSKKTKAPAPKKKASSRSSDAAKLKRQLRKMDGEILDAINRRAELLRRLGKTHNVVRKAERRGLLSRVDRGPGRIYYERAPAEQWLALRQSGKPARTPSG